MHAVYMACLSRSPHQSCKHSLSSYDFHHIQSYEPCLDVYIFLTDSHAHVYIKRAEPMSLFANSRAVKILQT